MFVNTCRQWKTFRSKKRFHERNNNNGDSGRDITVNKLKHCGKIYWKKEKSGAWQKKKIPKLSTFTYSFALHSFVIITESPRWKRRKEDIKKTWRPKHKIFCGRLKLKQTNRHVREKKYKFFRLFSLAVLSSIKQHKGHEKLLGELEKNFAFTSFTISRSKLLEFHQENVSKSKKEKMSPKIIVLVWLGFLLSFFRLRRFVLRFLLYGVFERKEFSLFLRRSFAFLYFSYIMQRDGVKLFLLPFSQLLQLTILHEEFIHQTKILSQV